MPMANLVDELVVGDATSQAAFGTRNTCASLLARSTLYTKRSAQNSIICFWVRKTELYHFIKFIAGNAYELPLVVMSGWIIPDVDGNECILINCYLSISLN